MAVVRAAMVAAAAHSWNVAESECTTCKGEVMHTASGRRLAYGHLVSAARGMPPQRLAGRNLRENIAPSAGLRLIATSPMPSVSLSQLKHEVLIFEKAA